MRFAGFFNGTFDMVGPQPAGRRWTAGEEKQLLDLLASGAKAPAIARAIKRSTGAVYARINVLRGLGRKSLPSERLAASRDVASRMPES
jgi:hypothetical protein